MKNTAQDKRAFYAGLFNLVGAMILAQCYGVNYGNMHSGWVKTNDVWLVWVGGLSLIMGLAYTWDYFLNR